MRLVCRAGVAVAVFPAQVGEPAEALNGFDWHHHGGIQRVGGSPQKRSVA